MSLSTSWLSILNMDELKDIERKICERTLKEKICPPISKWLEAMILTPLDSVRIIIIGQDPYHTKGTAHGLAFSSLDRKIPPSLLNIYKCLQKNSLIKDIPTTANLTEWTRQGILLLNIALSTEEGKAKHHINIWKPFTTQLIQSISIFGKNNHITQTYLLWGKVAQSVKSYIDEYHHVMEWIHPSPWAQRWVPLERQFIHCDHFSSCHKRYGTNWNVERQASIVPLKTLTNEHNIHEEKKESSQISDVSNTHVMGNDDMILQAFTDGACIYNGTPNAKGGFAVLFVGGCLKGIHIQKSINGTASNIIAEGNAIVCALEKVRELSDSQWTRFEIYTDSKFWVQMITEYMPKWSPTKFNQMKNPELTKKCWTIWNSFPKNSVHLIHVPSHDKLGWSKSEDPYKRWCNHYNHMVDVLASETIKK